MERRPSDNARVSVCDPSFASWLVGSIRSGLVAIDAAGAVTALNAEAHRLLDCASPSAEGALGCDCRAVLSHQPAMAQLLLDALDGSERPSRTEICLDRRDGRPELTIGYTLGAVRDAAGQVCGAVLQFRDLTPYERSAEQARLRERLAALGEMAAGLAHEIRNPLASMEIATGLLARRLADDPDAKALVQELQGEVRRVAATVTESLEFVRPVVLRNEPVDPVHVLEEALTCARSRIDYDGDVVRDYDPDLPPVLADEAALQGLFTNLIVNAFEAIGDARPPAPRLRLALEVVDAAESRPAAVRRGEVPELVFTVADNGPGIPDELRERVFYPFFTTRGEGSGVGLANVQKVVAGHGGRVELESVPGAGATFRVRLPLGPREAA